MLAKLQNFNVGAKILGIVGLCLVALAGVAGLSIWQMSLIGGEIEEIAEQDIRLAIMLLIGVSIGAILFALVASWFLVQRTLTRPLGAVVTALEALIAGDTTVEVTIYAEDEIGAVATALETFRQKIIENNEMAEQAAAEQREREARGKRIEELNRGFESSVAGVVNAVSDASGQIKAAAETMAATAEETSAQSTAVAAASEQATANVQTVASATEEMSASISEIGGQVAQSSDITKRAVAEAESTNVAVQGLAEAAQKIGKVVNLINDIAAQTNLLALNATIEAARAGEAGKGFAVVASEVKSLADQTAKATDEIGSQITGMQGVTEDVVKAIEGIGKTITEVNEIATVIASVVEEQGAATQEIARNVHEAAKGTQEVNANISGVTAAAGETGTAANQMLASAGELADQSDKLRQEVDKFLAEVRAA